MPFYEEEKHLFSVCFGAIYNSIWPIMKSSGKCFLLKPSLTTVQVMIMVILLYFILENKYFYS